MFCSVAKTSLAAGLVWIRCLQVWVFLWSAWSPSMCLTVQHVLYQSELLSFRPIFDSSLFSDCLQSLAVFPVFWSRTAELQKDNSLQAILFGGSDEVSVHIARQWWSYLRGTLQFHLYRYSAGQVLAPSLSQWICFLYGVCLVGGFLPPM